MWCTNPTVLKPAHKNEVTAPEQEFHRDAGVLSAVSRTLNGPVSYVMLLLRYVYLLMYKVASIDIWMWLSS